MIGIQFSNLNKEFNENDFFSMAHVLLFLLLDNFLHIFFIYYFDNLFPGDHGIAKPWYFMFSSFIKTKNNNFQPYINEAKKNYFEDESVYVNRRIGIKIKNLFKLYTQLGVKKTAVENLNLNIYEGQITVLLGN